MERRYIVHSETGVEPTTIAFQVMEDALRDKESRVLLVVPAPEFPAARDRALEVVKRAGVTGYQRESERFAEWGNGPSVLVAVPSANLCGQGYTHIIVAMGPFTPGEVAAKPTFEMKEGEIQAVMPKENMSEEDVLRLPSWFFNTCMTRSKPGSLVLLTGSTMHSGLRALCVAIGTESNMIDWWVRDFHDIGPVRAPLLPTNPVQNDKGQWMGTECVRMPDILQSAAGTPWAVGGDGALPGQIQVPVGEQPWPELRLSPLADADMSKVLCGTCRCRPCICQQVARK